MFSGKTEFLIAAVNRAKYAQKSFKILKPAFDTRTEDFIASRAVLESGDTAITNKLPAERISSEADLMRTLAADDYSLLVIDEVQFFPLDESTGGNGLGWFGTHVRELLRRRKEDQLDVIAAGLDLDAYERPFGVVPGLLALANTVVKLKAVCMECRAEGAHLTSRLISGDRLHVGDRDEYAAHCRRCHSAAEGT